MLVCPPFWPCVEKLNSEVLEVLFYNGERKASYYYFMTMNYIIVATINNGIELALFVG